MIRKTLPYCKYTIDMMVFFAANKGGVGGMQTPRRKQHDPQNRPLRQT